MSITTRCVAHALLSRGACCCCSEPRSLRGLPDTMFHCRHWCSSNVTVRLSMVHLGLVRRVHESVDRRTSRWRCSHAGWLIVMRVRIHPKAGFRVAKGAHSGLPVVVEGHGYMSVAGAFTSA